MDYSQASSGKLGETWQQCGPQLIGEARFKSFVYLRFVCLYLCQCDNFKLLIGKQDILKACTIKEAKQLSQCNVENVSASLSELKTSQLRVSEGQADVDHWTSGSITSVLLFFAFAFEFSFP